MQLRRRGDAMIRIAFERHGGIRCCRKPAAIACAMMCMSVSCGSPPAGKASGEIVSSTSGDVRFRVETLAMGLEVPWDIEFVPDGRIFVTERPGRVRVIADGLL